MRLMRWVYATQFESHAIPSHVRMNPSGRVAFVEHIGDRRQIDEMDSALILPVLPDVRVPENIRFDLLARADDIQKRRGIFEITSRWCQDCGE